MSVEVQSEDFAECGASSHLTPREHFVKNVASTEWLRDEPESDEDEEHDDFDQSEPDWVQVEKHLAAVRDWLRSSDDPRRRLSHHALSMLCDAIDEDICDAELMTRFRWAIVRIANTINGCREVPIGEEWRMTVATMLRHHDFDNFLDELSCYQMVSEDEDDQPAS